MPFALDGTASNTELSDAVNYLLANFGANIIGDPNTGIITGPGGEIVGYLYKYLAVKYADSQDGSLNFSNTQTNRLYYGLRNSNDSVESTNPVDYVWYKVTGGFSTTKTLYYKTAGGRVIEFQVNTVNPGTGWAAVGLTSIDLDDITAVTSGSQTFVAYFSPSSLQVPYEGNPPAPVFTGITPRMYANTGTGPVTFVAAQTDSDVTFINNTWRIGGSASTGNTDITYSNIIIGPPSAVSGYAQWPQPTVMTLSPAYISVPVRYKDAFGVITQMQTIQQQFVFSEAGPRSALIYFFYTTPQASAPSAPTAGQVSYDFATSTPSISAAGWSSTFNPAAAGTVTASNKYWGVRVIFQEDTYGGSYSETISSVFPWQNFDGLVTFTNLANSQGPLGTTTTFIDGGSITANSLTVNKITSSSAAIVSGRTFGLGQGASAFGLGGTVVANTTDASASGMLSVGGNTTYGGFAVVGATSNSGSATAGGAFGNATSTGYTSWRTYGLIGQASQAGTFLHSSSGNTGLIANASYAFYASVGGYGPFTGEHDALLAKGAAVQVGDIVCDTGFAIVQEMIDTITEVQVSSAPNQKAAVGVFHVYGNPADVPSAMSEVVTDPNTGIQTRVIKPEYLPLFNSNDLVIIASVGEGTLNVCGENGDIEVGDLIVTSSMPGKGMKQADDVVRSYTVAKARQAVSFSSPTEVKQIACIYMCG